MVNVPTKSAAVDASVKKLQDMNAAKEASMGSNIARGIAFVAVIGAIANFGLEIAENFSKAKKKSD